jgi:Na+-translocating ferredoxin:NAD+ oxidoreductase subunit A
VNEMLIIVFSAILVDNFVLSRFLGICPFLGVSKKIRTAVGMSLAVIVVMILASAITYPLYAFLLVPYDLMYLRTIVFILVIASLVQSVEMILKKISPPLYDSLGVFLPLITTNCAILGVTLLNIDLEYTFLRSVVHGLGAGLGFLLAMVLFAGVRSRLERADVPRFMKGLPITLVSASFVSISFIGFKGLIEKIFS